MALLHTPASERPIDRAITLAATDDVAGALRYAVPVLEKDPGAALAAFVVGRGLGRSNQSALAARALTLAAAAAVNAGNLPLAVACGVELRALGSDPGPIFDEIASAFARGSSRLGARRAGPPELPGAEPDFQPLADSVDEDALIERARSALSNATESSLAEAARAPIAPQPLFSALDAQSLREFVSIFEVRVLPSAVTLIEEGTFGDEAFIVARGEVEVEKGASGEGGAAVKLARLGAGALVGEMALLSRAPRAATVTTLRPSIVLVAKKEALD
ncbi:MAG TPA: cyclic nucleotide-binding domain-containing protein, partial [Polyangiaceae bacterium]